MLALHIRRARPDDAGEVVDLMRQSFRPEDLDMTIYGCDGIAAYLRLEFAQRRSFSTSTYLVAVIGERIVGFVELRSLESGLHLNYIATNSAWREMGIGRELLASALRACDSRAGSQFTLNVFENNATAQSWYRRNGFRILRRKAFWRVALSAGVVEGGWRVAGLPQADVIHRALGFSSFNLIHGGRSLEVGRLAERWFRITDCGLINCREALHALQALEPHREILFVGPEEEISPDLRLCCSPKLWSLQMGLQL